MARMKAHPRYNVVSMRISKVELRHLEDLMEKTHQSVSNVMREAIEYFAAHHEHAKPDRRVDRIIHRKPEQNPVSRRSSNTIKQPEEV